MDQLWYRLSMFVQPISPFADDVSWIAQLKQFPSLLIFHASLGLSPSMAMELCCLVGGGLALLMMIFRAMRCTVMFGVLWALYLSLYKVNVSIA